jgi:hypothetical protein
MLTTISGSRNRPSSAGRGQFPKRRIHVIDVENLAGAAAPTLGQVCQARGLYTGRMAVGAADRSSSPPAT